MKNEEINYEKILKELDGINLDSLGKEVTTLERAKAEAVDQSELIKKICSIYCKIRPIMVAVSNFGLIPEKIRSAIKMIIRLLDMLCNCKG